MFYTKSWGKGIYWGYKRKSMKIYRKLEKKKESQRGWGERKFWRRLDDTNFSRYRANSYNRNRVITLIWKLICDWTHSEILGSG